MKLEPLTLEALPGEIPITLEDFTSYIGSPNEDVRGRIDARGPWGIIAKFSAPCIRLNWKQTEYGAIIESATLYGWRTMGNPKESGCSLEGTVSIKGRKISAYTSSALWRLPDGRLISSATINVRGGYV